MHLFYDITHFVFSITSGKRGLGEGIGTDGICVLDGICVFGIPLGPEADQICAEESQL